MGLLDIQNHTQSNTNLNMAQMECDQFVVPPTDGSRITSSSTVSGSPSTLVLTGYSPNKASAALTLSSLFRSSSATATANIATTSSETTTDTSLASAMVDSVTIATSVPPTVPTRPTAFITPLDKSSNHLKRQSYHSSMVTDSVKHGPADADRPANVTASVNKKAKASRAAYQTAANPCVGDRHAVHDMQPLYGLHVPEGHSQPMYMDKPPLDKHKVTNDGTTDDVETSPLPYDYIGPQPQYYMNATTPQGFVHYYQASARNPVEFYYTHPMTHMRGPPSSNLSNNPVLFHQKDPMVSRNDSSSSSPHLYRSMSQSNLVDETSHPKQQSQPHVTSPLNGILSINSTPFSPPPLPHPAPYGHMQPINVGVPFPPPPNPNGNSGCVMVPHAVYYFHGNPMNPYGHPAGASQWMPPNPAFYIPTVSLPTNAKGRTKMSHSNASFIPITSTTDVEHTTTLQTKTVSRKKAKSSEPKTKVTSEVNLSTSLDYGNLSTTFYNRKEKSLGLLSEHFIAVFSSLPPATTMDAETSSTVISIDQAAAHLGVERRRIYDIVNVLESLKIVSRKCKNTYYWHGTQDLMDTFADLQEEALFGNMNLPVSGKDISCPQTASAVSAHGQMQFGYGIEEALQSGLISSSSYVQELHSSYIDNQDRRDNDEMTVSEGCFKATSSNSHAKCKTLAKLSQRFVQYFLVGHVEVSLIDSSEQILGYFPPEAEEIVNEANDKKSRRDLNTLKSKIRRLYDVANVFTSLKIIEKKNTGNNFSSVESCRPSFKWCWDLTPREILDRRISTKTTRHVNLLDGTNSR